MSLARFVFGLTQLFKLLPLPLPNLSHLMGLGTLAKNQSQDREWTPFRQTAGEFSSTEESDMHAGRRTYTKNTIHTHTQIYMTYTHTQTGQQVLPFPYYFATPDRPVCVCVGSGDHEDKQSRRCRAPILGVAAARPWSRGGVPPRWLWPEEEDKGDVGPLSQERQNETKQGKIQVTRCGF